MLATEVAAIDHSTGSVYLMAIAWNLNGSDEGVDGAYDRAIERLDAMDELSWPRPSLPPSWA